MFWTAMLVSAGTKTGIEKKAFYRWRMERQTLPFELLVRRPNCGLHCIGTDYEFSCGCDSCLGLQMYEDSELRDRSNPQHAGYISAADWVIIKNMNDAKYGFYSEQGCVLPRKWRPEECLRYVCEHAVRQ